MIIADLHLHSRFSRATSKDLTIANLEKYARIKGLDILGTGDFTHPEWLKELKRDLAEDGTGILKTKAGFNFMLQTEVSNIYNQGNKLRKVHNIILAKNFEIVDQINELLSKKGNLRSDGRPIFGSYSCIELVEDLMKISEDIEIIPAHCLTPWFAIFGSMSGFDKIEDCFMEKTKYIHALETGMSATPDMIWRVDNWNKMTLVSNSDSHSHWPWRIGREANVFELKDMTYKNIINAIRTKKGFKETVEVDPGYGKYHYDGHRLCHVCMAPSEAIKNRNICPKCGRKLTIGVAHRIEELADRPEGFVPEGAVPFRKLIPLSEIISAATGSGIAAAKTWKIFNGLISEFGNEFNVLLNAEEKDLLKIADEKVAKAIIDNRNEKIKIQPGYDGEYGYPVFDNTKAKEIKEEKRAQKGLGEFIR